VRLQIGPLRLDHLHDQALCGPKGEGDLDLPHNAADRAFTSHCAHAVHLPLYGAPPCRAKVLRLESVFE
jgi:hypothetical protein